LTRGFPLGIVMRAASRENLMVPHEFQQLLIVLLTPH